MEQEAQRKKDWDSQIIYKGNLERNRVQGLPGATINWEAINEADAIYWREARERRLKRDPTLQAGLDILELMAWQAATLGLGEFIAAVTKASALEAQMGRLGRAPVREVQWGARTRVHVEPGALAREAALARLAKLSPRASASRSS